MEEIIYSLNFLYQEREAERESRVNFYGFERK